MLQVRLQSCAAFLYIELTLLISACSYRRDTVDFWKKGVGITARVPVKLKEDATFLCEVIFSYRHHGLTATLLYRFLLFCSNSCFIITKGPFMLQLQLFHNHKRYVYIMHLLLDCMSWEALASKIITTVPDKVFHFSFPFLCSERENKW